MIKVTLENDYKLILDIMHNQLNLKDENLIGFKNRDIYLEKENEQVLGFIAVFKVVDIANIQIVYTTNYRYYKSLLRSAINYIKEDHTIKKIYIEVLDNNTFLATTLQDLSFTLERKLINFSKDSDGSQYCLILK